MNQPWYRNRIFPLLPTVYLDMEGWGLSWLFLNAWILPFVSFGIELEISPYFAGVSLTVPFFKVAIGIQTWWMWSRTT